MNQVLFDQTLELCPPGTLGVRQCGKTRSSACIPCPAGEYCAGPGASLSDDPLDGIMRGLCPRGYFCPVGTAFGEDFPCPPGTFSNRTGLVSIGECTPCPLGYLCPEAGLISPHICPSGSFCDHAVHPSTSMTCPAGTFSPFALSHNSTVCKKCPIGHFCPAGSSTALSCPVGTYLPTEGATELTECIPCIEGFSCPTSALQFPNHTCAQGHFCPTGTQYPTQYMCPAGTFTFSESLASFDQCELCQPGKACKAGTGFSGNLADSCRQGHFCPEGTVSPEDNTCPPGTYSNARNLTSASQCSVCPAGLYCLAGSASPSGQCSRGHYCPAGSTKSTAYACSAGTFSDVFGAIDNSSCMACPIGSYCPKGSKNPLSCRTGTQSLALGSTRSDECVVCEAGVLCLQSRIAPRTQRVECGKGYYGLPGGSECFVCESGYYCPEDTTSQTTMLSLQCPAGKFCPQGTAEPLENCSIGLHCPKGTRKQLVCPPGTYAPSPGLSACIACPFGNFCIGGRAPIPSGPCSVGFVCPNGSSSRRQNKCPQGFFANGTKLRDLSECTICPSGYFCRKDFIFPSLCPPGRYCIKGSSSPEKCPKGTFSNLEGLKEATECTPCTPSKFCDTSGSTSPTGTCKRGHFCTIGAIVNNPGDTSGSITADGAGVCPQGFYCPEGTSNAIPCPVGTFRPDILGISLGSCFKCPRGSFCNDTGLVSPSGLCSAGYYCDGGATSPTQHPSRLGYFSESGAVTDLPCPIGTFSDQPTAIKCNPCLGGFHCPQSGTVSPVLCPEGAFCPDGTSIPVACPVGTYNSLTGRILPSECLPCSRGKFCSNLGLSEPTGNCLGGYICFGGSTVPDPDGSECPKGSYCPSGAVSPQLCPPGTFLSVLGQTALSDCIPCTPGKYCGVSGLTAPGGNCHPGFFCGLGSDRPNPDPLSIHPASNTSRCSPWVLKFESVYSNQSSNFDGSNLFLTEVNGQCSKGHYCPAGSKAQKICPAGKFQNHTGQESCIPCPQGTLCPHRGTVDPIRCPVGAFCPQGSLVSQECPQGTIGARSGLAEKTECQPCPLGKFCSLSGLSVPSGDCAPGYWCTTGSIDMFGKTVSMSFSECPSGFYCPEGTQSPRPCPAGTFSNITGSKSIMSCKLCPAGMFCPVSGASSPAGVCDGGFWCRSGSRSRNTMDLAPGNYSSLLEYNRTISDEELCLLLTNSSCLSIAFTHCLAQVGGFSCPKGHSCKPGTTAPQPCPAGTFADDFGQQLCMNCPSSFFCPMKTSSLGQNFCRPGAYCPEGTKNSRQFLCPVGTYQPSTGASSLEDCITCPAGAFCNISGLSFPSGDCSPGFYCPGGSAVHDPRNSRCPNGTMCPAAASSPVTCPGGYYCNGSELPVGPCWSGSFCQKGAWAPNPPATVPGWYGVCPKGFYCPEKTTNPIPCAIGTFNPVLGATDESFCRQCPPSIFCTVSGLSTFSDSPLCPAGWYCPGAQNLTSTALKNSSSIKVECPAGFYCKEGSSSPRACEPGTFQAKTHSSVCEDCPMGFLCQGRGVIEPILCPHGMICKGNTSIENARFCPPGTFSNLSGLTSISQCLDCPSGKYCSDLGNTSPTGVCDAGYWCRRGSSTPRPGEEIQMLAATKCGINSCMNAGIIGDNFTLTAPGYLCPKGQYCPRGVTVPRPCPSGTFSSFQGIDSPTNCSLCLAGSHCPFPGMIAPLPFCPDGMLCPVGSGFNLPPCSKGYFCLNGTSTKCPFGQFNNKTGMTQCEKCPARHFCPNSGMILPEACPKGHFCPGMDIPNKIPCPQGTFSNRTGLLSSNECVPCPRGRYCGETGLYRPSGKCSAGYICFLGATSAIPVVNQTFEQPVTGILCPAGNFCPLGSKIPLPCPPGTFNEQETSTSQADCTPCSAGYLCSSTGMITPGSECPPKFYCPTGTAGSGTAIICPSGSFCKNGSARPSLCPKGTYQTLEGSSFCHVCPSGKFCPEGTSNPLNCPLGSYCPEGSPHLNTSAAQHHIHGTNLCPPGTFGNVTQLFSDKQCEPCTAGFYCAAAGLYEPTGPCQPGFYCLRGSSLKAPRLNAVDSKCVGSEFKGGLCAAGFICSGGNDSPWPDETNGFACAAGTFCAEGAQTPSFCAKGTYNPTSGQGECQLCPPGRMCPMGAITPQACPIGRYCPGSGDDPQGILCPPGTFQERENLTSAEQCSLCPKGKFCTNGEITGNCSAGYFCSYGNSQPVPPSGMIGKGFICPSGYFCPAGAAKLQQCPNKAVGTVGARSTVECGECPPGNLCFAGNSSMRLCDVGHYCSSSESVPCPLFTFNDQRGKSSISSCLACPAGYFCNTTGIGDAKQFPCPVGSVCFTRAESPVRCPAGSYRPMEGGGAQNLEDCWECSEGHYCPTVGTVTPIVCPSGRFCPPRSAFPSVCPLGTYCPPSSSAPIPCPGGFLCDVETNIPNRLCGQGTYCPQNTSFINTCPPGYADISGTHIRASQDQACRKCPAGEYSYGNQHFNLSRLVYSSQIPGTDSTIKVIHMQANACRPCLAGYVCLSGAKRADPSSIPEHNGFECPEGHVCPQGSGEPLPCPTGRYNGNKGSTDLQSCQECSAGRFADNLGSTACKSCASSSFSNSGARACSCIGANRVFQPSNAHCVCRLGYRSFRETSDVSLKDGIDDCQPKLLKSCRSIKARQANGDCSEDCLKQCPKGGDFISTTGLCFCSGVTPLDVLCDASCRNNAAKTLFVSFVDNSGARQGQIHEVIIPETSSLEPQLVRTISVNTAQDLFGEIACPKFVALDSEDHTSPGFVARHLLPSVSFLREACFINKVGTFSDGRLYGAIGLDSSPETSRRRQLQEAGEGALIPNPLICIREGENIMINEPLGALVYDRDSLLNTKDDFDAGILTSFSGLTPDSNMSLLNLNVLDAGVYVFTRTIGEATSMIVKVVGEGQECPLDSPILPRTETNMILLGLRKREDSLQELNWLELGIMLGIIFIFLMVTFLAIRFIQKSKWYKNMSINAAYKVNNQNLNLSKLHSASNNILKSSSLYEYSDSYEREGDLRPKAKIITAYDSSGGDRLLKTDEIFLYFEDIYRYLARHIRKSNESLRSTLDGISFTQAQLPQQMQQFKLSNDASKALVDQDDLVGQASLQLLYLHRELSQRLSSHKVSTGLLEVLTTICQNFLGILKPTPQHFYDKVIESLSSPSVTTPNTLNVFFHSMDSIKTLCDQYCSVVENELERIETMHNVWRIHITARVLIDKSMRFEDIFTSFTENEEEFLETCRLQVSQVRSFANDINELLKEIRKGHDEIAKAISANASPERINILSVHVVSKLNDLKFSVYMMLGDLHAETKKAEQWFQCMENSGEALKRQLVDEIGNTDDTVTKNHQYRSKLTDAIADLRSLLEYLAEAPNNHQAMTETQTYPIVDSEQLYYYPYDEYNYPYEEYPAIDNENVETHTEGDNNESFQAYPSDEVLQLESPANADHSDRSVSGDQTVTKGYKEKGSADSNNVQHNINEEVRSSSRSSPHGVAVDTSTAQNVTSTAQSNVTHTLGVAGTEKPTTEHTSEKGENGGQVLQSVRNLLQSQEHHQNDAKLEDEDSQHRVLDNEYLRTIQDEQVKLENSKKKGLEEVHVQHETLRKEKESEFVSMHLGKDASVDDNIDKLKNKYQKEWEELQQKIELEKQRQKEKKKLELHEEHGKRSVMLAKKRAEKHTHLAQKHHKEEMERLQKDLDEDELIIQDKSDQQGKTVEEQIEERVNAKAEATRARVIERQNQELRRQVAIKAESIKHDESGQINALEVHKLNGTLTQEQVNERTKTIKSRTQQALDNVERETKAQLEPRHILELLELEGHFNQKLLDALNKYGSGGHDLKDKILGKQKEVDFLTQRQKKIVETNQTTNTDQQELTKKLELELTDDLRRIEQTYMEEAKEKEKRIQRETENRKREVELERQKLLEETVLENEEVKQRILDDFEKEQKRLDERQERERQRQRDRTKISLEKRKQRMIEKQRKKKEKALKDAQTETRTTAPKRNPVGTANVLANNEGGKTKFSPLGLKSMEMETIRGSLRSITEIVNTKENPGSASTEATTLSSAKKLGEGVISVSSTVGPDQGWEQRSAGRHIDVFSGKLSKVERVLHQLVTHLGISTESPSRTQTLLTEITSDHFLRKLKPVLDLLTSSLKQLQRIYPELSEVSIRPATCSQVQEAHRPLSSYVEDTKTILVETKTLEDYSKVLNVVPQSIVSAILSCPEADPQDPLVAKIRKQMADFLIENAIGRNSNESQLSSVMEYKTVANDAPTSKIMNRLRQYEQASSK